MRRLYKSRNNKVIDGVCAGIADHFAIDPVLIRLIWVLSFFFGGTGIIAYIIAMLIIPEEPKARTKEKPMADPQSEQSKQMDTEKSINHEEAKEYSPYHSTQTSHSPYYTVDSELPPDPTKRGYSSLIFGLILVFFGAVLLAEKLFGISINFRTIFRSIQHYMWPSILILIGVFLLIRRNRL
ncbi:PspC domain-containing protein [Caldalkalibacillus mannanilyticus]|uniref:PspC domain-containing protein n=1 Tax=Caldalkalibacillus mannanilyticus TaxID=1418 RepID=UPI00046AE0FA|nr:PspC domain-containing protein [Caldalkalibacillus mannanilyticus]